MSVDSKSLDIYTTGTRAWFQDEKQGWILGVLTVKSLQQGNLIMKFKLEGSGKVCFFNFVLKSFKKSFEIHELLLGSGI